MGAPNKTDLMFIHPVGLRAGLAEVRGRGGYHPGEKPIAAAL
jgi:hypothetical protein